MRKTRLPGFETVWYICYYFKSGTSDYISRQIMDFKVDHKPQIATFSELAGQAVKGIDMSIDYVIRVLGSKELTATKPNRVRDIAIAIAKTLQAEYRPQMIKKNRKTYPLKGLSKEKREKELEGVYELNDCPNLSKKNVLIVDDIFTFGTSIEAVGRVLKGAYPSVKLYGFALAHNWHKGTEGIDINEKEFVDLYKETLVKFNGKK